MRELLPKGPQDRTSTDDQRRAMCYSNSVWFHGSWSEQELSVAATSLMKHKSQQYVFD